MTICSLLAILACAATARVELTPISPPGELYVDGHYITKPITFEARGDSLFANSVFVTRYTLRCQRSRYPESAPASERFMELVLELEREAAARALDHYLECGWSGVADVLANSLREDPAVEQVQVGDDQLVMEIEQSWRMSLGGYNYCPSFEFRYLKSFLPLVAGTGREDALDFLVDLSPDPLWFLQYSLEAGCLCIWDRGQFRSLPERRRTCVHDSLQAYLDGSTDAFPLGPHAGRFRAVRDSLSGARNPQARPRASHRTSR